jgi:hypothetical protein
MKTADAFDLRQQIAEAYAKQWHSPTIARLTARRISRLAKMLGVSRQAVIAIAIQDAKIISHEE